MDTKKAVDAFLASCRARGLSPHTVRWYRGILLTFAKKNRRLPKSPEKIEQFMTDCCNSGDERRHGYYRAIRRLYRFLERRHDIKNPMVKVDAPKRKKKYPHSLTPDELDQLLSYPHPPKMKTALMFLADTGCRIGELANLSTSDLSETAWGYIARVTGKTDTRFVPLSNETYNALLKNLPFGYSVFRLRRLISMAFANARIRGSAHTLRHTFGTLWQGDESTLQEIMGHTTFQTTKLYRHLRTERLSIQHHKFSPLNMIFTLTKRMGL